MNQNRTPLYTALINHRNRKPVSFHVPGHKNGQVFPAKALEAYGEVLKIDVTELTGLDDLHAPEGVIKEAEELLADLYGSQRSFFLVNGSTAGNLAMILAACREGDRVLVQRNCHKSILHALMLARAKPVFISPGTSASWGIAGVIQASAVEEALALYPDCRAVVLTSPSYYGETGPIREIVQAAHARSIPVLVDEAHGAHHLLHGFPEGALAQGADAAVQSAHKTLPAMTMGSYLHLNSALIDPAAVSRWLHIIQSSSPSYPIMASLDLARSYLAGFGEQDTSRLLKQAADFRKELSALPGISCMESADPLKITMRSAAVPDGFKLQKLLEEAGIYPELAGPNHVLFVLPLLKSSDGSMLEDAISRIKEILPSDIPSADPFPDAPVTSAGLSALEVPYSEMEQLPKEYAALSEAAGRTAAEMIIPYPPGIPLIMAGEKITVGMIKELRKLLKSGSRFHGGESLKEERLLVFR